MGSAAVLVCSFLVAMLFGPKLRDSHLPGRPPSDDVEWAPAAESSPWRRPRVGTLFIPKDGQADGFSGEGITVRLI